MGFYRRRIHYREYNLLGACSYYSGHLEERRINQPHNLVHLSKNYITSSFQLASKSNNPDKSDKPNNLTTTINYSGKNKLATIKPSKAPKMVSICNKSEHCQLTKQRDEFHNNMISVNLNEQWMQTRANAKLEEIQETLEGWKYWENVQIQICGNRTRSK